MSLLTSAIEKASSAFVELNEKVPAIQKASDFVVEQVSANVPLPMLVKGVQIFQTVKQNCSQLQN